jgi:hypothetical protein
MTLKLNASVKIIAGLLVSFCVTTAAQAVMPEPMNIKDAVNMSFDQRLAHTSQIYSAASKSSPQEIDAYLGKTISQMQALSPADQQYIEEKRQANWKALTPAQRNAIRLQQRAYVKSLPQNVQDSMNIYTAGREYGSLNAGYEGTMSATYGVGAAAPIVSDKGKAE